MKRTRAVFWLILPLFLAAGPAPAARRAAEPLTSREPVDNHQRTTLVGRTGQATITRAGERARVRLRRFEKLVEIAEAGTGWVAAGIGEKAHGADLLVVRQAASGVRRLPSPARGGGLHRVAPRLLIGGGELAGIAWLEGERSDRLAVRAAQWNGAAWIASTVVSEPAPGSQTGLAQAVLQDGTWLLVWSRFDGRENELVWSRRAGGNWTPPAAVEAADGVPDVTPTLVASGGGALLAWSEYDGRDYRLRGARFDGGGWRRLDLDAGPGVVQPKFRRRPEGTWVLARSAAPRGWLALEVETGDVAGGIIRVETEAQQRPLLRPSGAGMSFEWPARRREPVR